MFKKIFFTLAAVLCLASCNEDFADWSAPQSNPQEEAQTMSITATAASAIDLGSVTTETVPFATVNVTKPNEGFEVDSISFDFVDPTTGNTTPLATNLNGKVSTSDLTELVTGYFGVRPVARTLTLNARAYAWIDSTKTTRVSSEPYQFEVNVTPARPAFESGYYYIGVWGTDMSRPLTEESDGVWSVTVPANGGWHWFKIAPESGFVDGNFDWANEGSCICAPAKDDESTSGKFVIGGDKYSWHLVENGASNYKITIDLYDQTFQITPVE